MVWATSCLIRREKAPGILRLVQGPTYVGPRAKQCEGGGSRRTTCEAVERSYREAPQWKGFRYPTGSAPETLARILRLLIPDYF